VSTDNFLADLPLSAHIIAGYLYETNRGKEDFIVVNADFCEQAEYAGKIPKTAMQQCEKLLINLYTCNESEGIFRLVKNSQFPEVSIRFASMAYCKSNELWVLHHLITLLNDTGYISVSNDTYQKTYTTTTSNGQRVLPGFNTEFRLTAKGYERAEQLLSTNIDSKNVFVAMWFDKTETDAAWEAISNAVRQCGFEPFRVDKHEHNNYICDEIISGIKQSKFVIADLTGYRGGVYWEAGYAKGLGREVILTCRKDWCNGEAKDNKRIHFDLEQIVRIEWTPDKLDEFESSLKSRMIATVDGAKLTD
jgi:nucleoside 2-deoxyribosyltransferase